MAISEYHLAKSAISTFTLADDCVTRAKTHKQFIQAGSADLTLGFSAVGVEVVTATVTFATPFPSGVAPHVVYSPKVRLAITHAVISISNTGFVIQASDDLGTDYTTSKSWGVEYIAIAP
jgi:hypothetical protein